MILSKIKAISLFILAKRLTENQKEEIIKDFKDGNSIDFLSDKFNCSKLTISRNLKLTLGETIYKQINKKNKTKILKENFDDKNGNLERSFQNSVELKEPVHIQTEDDLYSVSPFLEISPVDYEIDNVSRKDFSSIPLSEVELPNIVYMIVDKKIELDIKLLGDYPEWEFLPIEDLKRKTIEIYFDLKIAKRNCSKEQKVIKVPNTEVFRITSSILISKGISRIVAAEKLIAL